ncbi:MAG TPA: cytochrome c3 family protein [Terriglobales bacterium]|nr:cytochrome c3 family protein [Terriglobales bacterium]
MKLLFFSVAVFVLALAPLSHSSRPKHEKADPAPVHGDYVGSDTCIACHDEPNASLERTTHRKLFADKEPSTSGCEACHGPGSEHVDGNGDAAKIFRFAAATVRQVNPRCSSCHSSLSKGHGHDKVNCVSCHSIHHASQGKAILVKSPPELCLGCHH